MKIDKEKVEFHTIKGDDVEICVYGQKYTVNKEITQISIPNEWRV